ncbi:MAG: riboflavin synthase [Phycisphaerales bacterium]
MVETSIAYLLHSFVILTLMFTGIIQARGSIASLQPNAFGARLRIDRGKWSYQPMPGDSIAVNGVCLTHAPASDPPGADPAPLCFDVIRETLARTNLGSLKVGDQVNLESSLRADTPIAGHFVQGHVDAVGKITGIHSGQDEYRLTVAVDSDVMPFIVPKGSIAIDGVSLTIASVNVVAPGSNSFTVALIPTTLDLTTLGSHHIGDTVNLETDMIVRSVVHVLTLQGIVKPASTLTMDKLLDAGFVE